MARLDELFQLMHDRNASDLHLFAGSEPALRIRGDMVRIAEDVLDHEELKSMLYEIASPQDIKDFEETGDLDFGYEIQGLARYRCNYFMQKTASDPFSERFLPGSCPSTSWECLRF
jgi:twitching motility protein PilT